MTDQELADLRNRNEARIKIAKEQLGTKYLCHPSNQITKKKFKKELRRNKALQNNV